jgi:hypothetical protein
MGFWEDVGCIKPLILCGTEDRYPLAQLREAAFKGKGSFLYMNHATLDMVYFCAGDMGYVTSITSS